MAAIVNTKTTFPQVKTKLYFEQIALFYLKILFCIAPEVNLPGESNVAQIELFYMTIRISLAQNRSYFGRINKTILQNDAKF